MTIDPLRPLLLGSGSPRRREILGALGIPIRVAKADIDETPAPGEDAESYLVRIVADKLAAVQRLPDVQGAAGVLVADTSVIAGGAVLGKPADAEEARSMLRSLSGRDHEVWTRFAVAAAGTVTGAGGAAGARGATETDGKLSRSAPSVLPAAPP
ncbi:MAG: Maf family protein [Polyangiaceae bacterium]